AGTRRAAFAAGHGGSPGRRSGARYTTCGWGRPVPALPGGRAGRRRGAPPPRPRPSTPGASGAGAGARRPSPLPARRSGPRRESSRRNAVLRAGSRPDEAGDPEADQEDGPHPLGTEIGVARSADEERCSDPDEQEPGHDRSGVRVTTVHGRPPTAHG